MQSKVSSPKRRVIYKTVIVLGTLLLSFLFICYYFASFVYIPTSSMSPTILANHYVLVSRFNALRQPPKRGDIIVYELDNVRYVKRVAALPNEVISCVDNKIYIDDKLHDELVEPQYGRTNDFGPVVVPEASYFVLGDNRENSKDSRVIGADKVTRENIIGIVYAIF